MTVKRLASRAKKRRRRAPEPVWHAVYTCGAFLCRRTAEAALQDGKQHQEACCARGWHAFDVIEYSPGKRIHHHEGEPGRRQPRAPKKAKAAEPRALLRRVERRVAGCTACPLAKTRHRTVFARGNPDAAICLVGEAPGADEDAEGKPFVGRAGQYLDGMLRELGLSPEEDVYICNVIKCRPPDNRKPTPDETAACSPFFHEQLAIWSRVVDPLLARSLTSRVIVALGATAIEALLDTKLPVGEIRGKWKLYRGRTMVMPTYHPSYLMKPFESQAESRRLALGDLRLAMKEVGREPALPPGGRGGPFLFAISGGLEKKPPADPTQGSDEH